MAFLVKVMQSIAYHERTKNRRYRSSAKLDETSLDAEPAQGNPVATASSPEHDLLSKEEAEAVEAIFGHFEDDEEAQLVLMGWADGLHGRELREATGLDQAGLDYARKRIRSRMRKLYPDGWTS